MICSLTLYRGHNGQHLGIIMVSVSQLFLLTFLLPVLHATEVGYHLITSPQLAVLEIGTNFTATCSIVNTDEVTADDLFWNLTTNTVPREQYTKINSTALNVTIPIREDTPSWLYCLCKKDSQYIRLNRPKFQHGILLQNGYPPEKPENLTCVAEQEEAQAYISPTITCQWQTRGRQTKKFPTTQTLFVKYAGSEYNVTTRSNKAQVKMEIFPNFIYLDIFVVAQNKLGRVESEHLNNGANSFAKTNPPSNVQVISEKTFPSTLLLNWTHPMPIDYIRLIYGIRYCPLGSKDWTYVPLADTARNIQSFRLQGLQPDTVYVSQVRCKYYKEGLGYWSDWSANATQRTPEDRPAEKPDLWRIISDDGANERQVDIVFKDPQRANGKITKFEVRIHGQKKGEQENITVNKSEGDERETRLPKKIPLPDNKSLKVHVAAFNSVGRSPEALMGIPAKLHEHDSVEGLRAWAQDGQLLVQWKPLNSTAVMEYVVEWRDGDQVDWQRELTTRTAIKGILEPFVCYNVSVYPIYSGWVGKAERVQAFLEQGAPAKAPEAKLKEKPGRNEATLMWDKIPDPYRRGFITNYTLFYGNGTKVFIVPLSANTTSYKLTSLTPNTKYNVWIQASTSAGSNNGSKSYFSTLQYAPGEIEGIVVGVSLGLMFFFLLSMLLCIYKRDVIKENFWPQIPNPGESTIGNWSPDYSLKAETPKENCLSGISVLDMDMCDAKCVFEEDKASLALKKDKYLSEEHSSGIGGSSCMSSPRQSVSDSDEGGDMADTTASTVQYSSVVASSGYKGQTPSFQAQQAVFSRSESTQPLLDSEENPDVLLEGSRPLQRFPRQPGFPNGPPGEDGADSQLEMELQDVMEPLDFCPLEEDAEPAAADDWLPSRPASSYMPQLGGYRPQCE